MFLQEVNIPWLQKFLIGEQDWMFVPEVLLRTLIMYAVILFSLRVMGKRGVKQLSVFELVVIIGLGSAAGDPMFYSEVGILNCILVFLVVVVAYMITSHIVSKNKKIEILLEGSCTCLIENGEFAIHNFEKEPLAQDEFFAELRLKGISHLGQVQVALIETNGSISTFYYPDNEVKHGLPVLPARFHEKVTEIKEKDFYSCSFCGHTLLLDNGQAYQCPKCKRDKWVKAINNKRIT